MGGTKFLVRVGDPNLLIKLEWGCNIKYYDNNMITYNNITNQLPFYGNIWEGLQICYVDAEKTTSL